MEKPSDILPEPNWGEIIENRLVKAVLAEYLDTAPSQIIDWDAYNTAYSLFDEGISLTVGEEFMTLLISLPDDSSLSFTPFSDKLQLSADVSKDLAAKAIIRRRAVSVPTITSPIPLILAKINWEPTYQAWSQARFGQEQYTD